MNPRQAQRIREERKSAKAHHRFSRPEQCEVCRRRDLPLCNSTGPWMCWWCRDRGTMPIVVPSFNQLNLFSGVTV